MGEKGARRRVCARGGPGGAIRRRAVLPAMEMWDKSVVWEALNWPLEIVDCVLRREALVGCSGTFVWDIVDEECCRFGFCEGI